jgi:O-methyltransferase involved in polyketide biosynthesis
MEQTKTIKFTEKGAVTKIYENSTVTIENWISSLANSNILSKEFFIFEGITYYLTSKVVKEIY